ncbi:MAG: hypothetical protein KDA24_24730 [Deltaproteobacteria bacterium]|nr:hypothetical protein [Deltaproteobacteria bacterium]
MARISDEEKAAATKYIIGSGARAPKDPPNGVVPGPLLWVTAFDETVAADEMMQFHNYAAEGLPTPASGVGDVNAVIPAGIFDTFRATVGDTLPCKVHCQALSFDLIANAHEATAQDVADLVRYLATCRIVVKKGKVEDRYPLLPHLNITGPEFFQQAVAAATASLPKIGANGRRFRKLYQDRELDFNGGDQLYVESPISAATAGVGAGIYTLALEMDACAYDKDIDIPWDEPTIQEMVAQSEGVGFPNKEY